MKKYLPYVFVILFIIVYIVGIPKAADAFKQEIIGRTAENKAETQPQDKYEPSVTPETTDKPASETTDKPVSETTDAPVSETADEPESEPADEPASETTGKPAPEETAQQSTPLPGSMYAPEIGTFQTVDSSYVNDAFFIGDSRMEDLINYGTFKNPHYYASVGLSVYNIDNENYNPTIPGIGKISFEDMLRRGGDYRKVYIMLGFNESGYAYSATVKQYQALIDRVRQAYPNAIIYLMANLHLTAYQSEHDIYSDNQAITEVNNHIATLADGINIFYIDINLNPVFCDEYGNLRPEVTGDGTHPKGKYYADWCDWILTRAVVR